MPIIRSFEILFHIYVVYLPSLAAVLAFSIGSSEYYGVSVTKQFKIQWNCCASYLQD